LKNFGEPRSGHGNVRVLDAFGCNGACFDPNDPRGDAPTR
jgi:hypothetical protein